MTDTHRTTEAVAYTLRWPDASNLNLPTTFATLDQAQRYADDCARTIGGIAGTPGVEIVPLYLSPELAGDVVAAMLEYNQMLRSFAMIASRNGKDTRWESLHDDQGRWGSLYDQIHALLTKHHATWLRYFPPMQPDDEQPETKTPARTDCYGAELAPISESDGAIYSAPNGGTRHG